MLRNDWLGSEHISQHDVQTHGQWRETEEDPCEVVSNPCSAHHYFLREVLMDCLPWDLPASAFSGTQLFSVSLSWLWPHRAAQPESHTGPQTPRSLSAQGPLEPLGAINGQETWGFMTAVSLKVTGMESPAQAAGRSWLIKVQPRRCPGDAFPPLGDTLLRRSKLLFAGLLQGQETQVPLQACWGPCPGSSRHLWPPPATSLLLPCPRLGLNMATLFLLLCTQMGRAGKREAQAGLGAWASHNGGQRK